jgi:hypothetical protein
MKSFRPRSSWLTLDNSRQIADVDAAVNAKIGFDWAAVAQNDEVAAGGGVLAGVAEEHDAPRHSQQD